MLFRPLFDADVGYHLDVDRALNYGPPQVRTSPAYDCALLSTQDGWVEEFTLTAQFMAGPYTGARTSAGDVWAGTQLAHANGTAGIGVVGTHPDPDQTRFLVAHDAFGSLQSTVTVVPEDAPIHVQATGSFWCLLGPAAFTGGTFSVTPTQVDARDLTWASDFEDGILLRIRASADVKSWHLVGPDGSSEPPAALTQDRTVDLQFCSDVPGRWELHLDQLTSDSNAGWQHAAAIFDIAPGLVGCTPGWTQAPIDRIDEAG